MKMRRFSNPQKKMLGAQIDAHLKKVSGNPAKTAVLEAAKEAMANPLKIPALHAVIQANPGYKKILDLDNTKKLIDEVIAKAMKKKPNQKDETAIQQDIARKESKLNNLTTRRDDASTSGKMKTTEKLNKQISTLQQQITTLKDTLPGALEASHQALFKRVEKQFAAMISKPSDKHNDKYEMMKLAMQCLKGSITPAELEAAKEKYPNYNKALFSSRTEKLVAEALLAVQTPVAEKSMELSAPEAKTEEDDAPTYSSGDSNRM